MSKQRSSTLTGNLDHDGKASTSSSRDNDIDSDSGIDDDVDAGVDYTGTLL